MRFWLWFLISRSLLLVGNFFFFFFYFYLDFVASIFSAHSFSKLQTTGFEMFVATHENTCCHNPEDHSRNFHLPPTVRISSASNLCTLKAEVGEIFPEALLRVSVLRQIPWRSAVFSVSACVLPICSSNWSVLVLWRRILWNPAEPAYQFAAVCILNRDSSFPLRWKCRLWLLGSRHFVVLQ